MTERGIDFNNVDRAFQTIASSPAGKKSLAELESAMENVHRSAGVTLNDHELKYMVASLANQYRAKPASPKAMMVGSFMIKTAVDVE